MPGVAQSTRRDAVVHLTAAAATGAVTTGSTSSRDHCPSVGQWHRLGASPPPLIVPTFLIFAPATILLTSLPFLPSPPFLQLLSESALACNCQVPIEGSAQEGEVDDVGRYPGGKTSSLRS